MKKLIEILRTKQVVFFIGVLLLILLIWLIGGWFGVSQNIRFLLILIVLVAFVVALVIQSARASKGAAELEQSLKSQAEDQKLSVRPEKR